MGIWASAKAPAALALAQIPVFNYEEYIKRGGLKDRLFLI